jgi:hypothetical protein
MVAMSFELSAIVATGVAVAVAGWLVFTTTDVTTHRCRALSGVKNSVPFPLESSLT